MTLPWFIQISLSFCNIACLSQQFSECTKHIHLSSKYLDQLKPDRLGNSKDFQFTLTFSSLSLNLSINFGQACKRLESALLIYYDYETKGQ